MFHSQREDRMPGGAAGRAAWLVLGLIALVVLVLAALLDRTAREPAGGSASSEAQGAPPGSQDLVLDEATSTRQPVAGPDEAAGAPPREPSRAETATVAFRDPAPVLVSGAAIRVDASGGEHTGEDGAFTVHAHFDGRIERRDVTVNGGQFALELPPHAMLHVSGLVLGGRKVRAAPAAFTVPADRFLVVRGAELLGVLLHVLAAEDGRELEGVDVYSASGPLFQAGWQHPGAGPEEPPRVRGARSPFPVEPSVNSSWTSYSYWVRAPGYAWGTIALDHAAGGERRLTLGPACALDVELVGLESWLQPLVRLWLPDADPRAGYPFAERRPDDQGRAAFEALPPGQLPRVGRARLGRRPRELRPGHGSRSRRASAPPSRWSSRSPSVPARSSCRGASCCTAGGSARGSGCPSPRRAERRSGRKGRSRCRSRP